jgi:hypothetical protein
MSKRAILLVLFLSALRAGWTTPARAQGCLDQKWCLEAESFAFRVKPEEDLSVEYVRRLESAPGSPDMGYVIDYLVENSESRMFLCWLRPTPSMHAVDFPWNVGFALKSGETVWAEKWIYGERGQLSAQDPSRVRRFVPGLQGTSAQGQSFLLFLVFPGRTPGGAAWRNGQVTGLVIQ